MKRDESASSESLVCAAGAKLILEAFPSDAYALSVTRGADLFILSFIEIVPYEIALFSTVIAFPNLILTTEVELVFYIYAFLLLSRVIDGFAVPKADLLLKLFIELAFTFVNLSF